MGEIYALSVGGRSLAGVAIIAASVLGGFACDTGPADDARSAWLHNTLIEDNQDHIREFSLRIAIKLGDLVRRDSRSFEKMARVTCCKGL